MRKRSWIVLMAVVVAVSVGVIAGPMGGARLKEWLLALHGVHSGAHSRRAPAGDTTSPLPVPWPETKAGALGRRWVEAFAAGEDAMRQFVAEDVAAASLAQRGVEERIATYRSLRQRLGPLKLASIVASTPGELEVILTASDDSPHGFTFMVQTEPPFKLLSVKLREAHSP